ncbi:type IVB secretion system protein IcmN/DotK [Legionella sp. CNM-1927-20]|uniref:type IVB secretion system protein IcmN/DotK n=1 Tax=Legionella sp. CNM-1927-20 TaxID=3422221 RepID=UPI00403A8D42
MKRVSVGYLTFLIRYFIVLASLVLTGCCCGNGKMLLLTQQGFKLPTRVKGSSDAYVIAQQAGFAKCGVQVITIGSDYLISIPSVVLFADQSPRIKWGSYSILNKVVKFMQQFRKVGVNVTSYGSPYISSKREQSLTLARARAVADYLWSQGIDSRFIFAEGAGSEKPISAFMQGGDRSLNSRIEITFRDVVA